MITKTASTYNIDIYMAGDIQQAQEACQGYCDETSYCVNLSPTEYIYKGGSEAGFKVGLINYARFPESPEQMFYRAEILAMRLIEYLGQDSFSIVTTEATTFYSRREEDVCQK